MSHKFQVNEVLFSPFGKSSVDCEKILSLTGPPLWKDVDMISLNTFSDKGFWMVAGHSITSFLKQLILI